MTYYHFVFNAEDGELVRGGAYFNTDEEAMDRARRLNSAHGIAVWQAARLVGKVEPLICC